VTLGPEGKGFCIIRSAPTLRAQVPNLDEATLTRLAGDQVNFLPDSTIDLGPLAGAHRRRFALSQNSKDLRAGSNSSEKTSIIGGIIITATDRSSRSCDRMIADRKQAAD
jgi:hypothetical protein